DKETGFTKALAFDQEIALGIALDDTMVYWGTKNGPRARTKNDNGATIPIADDAQTQNLIVDDMYVYFLSDVGGTLKRARKDGTGGTAVLATALVLPRGLAQDASALFFTVCGDNPGVMRLAK